jgi:sphingomyelin phosphodiesterase acid-like 3
MSEGMRGLARFVAAWLLFAALAGPPAQAGAAGAAHDLPMPTLAAGEGLFGVLSDIHFDPFYDPSLVDKLAAAQPEAWDGIFATSAVTRPSGAGSDSNYPLFKSALDSLGLYSPLLDYVLFPGDFLAHDFADRYRRYASDKSDAAYRAFVLKTMQYVVGAFKARLPKIPVIAALGNNDSFCGDYMIEPAGEFLYDTTAAMAALTGGDDGLASYPELGAYVFRHPQTPSHYFVVLNNLYFSVNYRNSCGLSYTDPAQALLVWVEATLYRMKRLNAGVTFIVHVPSGINAYSSTGACGAWGAPTPYQTTTNGQAFLNLLGQYPGQIKAMFTGHSHMDDFRVLADAASAPFAFQRVVPSISPIFGNNPGYQIYSYDRASGAPRNYLTRSFAAPAKGRPATWTLEYDFQQAYGLGPLGADSLKTLAGQIGSDKSVRAKYIQYYTGGAASGTITDKNWPAFACALTSIDAAAFSACYCGKPQ